MAAAQLHKLPDASERLHSGNAAAPKAEAMELSIIMPCLNEAETLALCVRKAKAFLVDNDIVGEVIVADNGSIDGSQQIANALGARVVHVPTRGYGAALIGGIAAAKGEFIVMGDADDSYDFGALMPFVAELRDGAELVMGNRFRGGIASGAMPSLHRYLGNPVLSFLGRTFFSTPVGDFHCGLRAFRRDAITALDLNLPGMEFASEMVVKASIAKLDIREVPTTLEPDGRSRPPHLRTWRDGWRHLRFLLIYAPRFLFFYPGMALTLAGLVGVFALMPNAVRIGHVEFSVHTMIFAAMAVLIGSQLIGLSVLARRYGEITGMWPETDTMRRLRSWFSIERACLLAAAMVVTGFSGAIVATMIWADSGFGAMNSFALMRITIPSMLLCCLGVQIAVAAFFAGLLDQPRR
ncbi:glycosyltransferase family 2 protein [Sphingomonas asaccharolytica]|uniref:glycosyltransferase family 2 protein n=1 Tax=Sphingomonas asaccharolytica TaxID=40681 RepID=UPI00082CFE6A|nr:glycosyltransferase family 2 protein [Sphingomonas asaccharolytica]